MQLDTERYRHHLDGFDMSEAEKVRLMEQLWAILHSLVTRAAGESPEQIILRIRDWENCNPDSDPLDSDHSISSTFNDAAEREAAGKSRL